MHRKTYTLIFVICILAVIALLLSIRNFIVTRSLSNKLHKIVAGYSSTEDEVGSMKEEIENYMETMRAVESSPPM